MNNSNPWILIPSFKPSHELVLLVKSLSNFNISNILIVEDGSGSEYQSIYDEISKIDSVTILVHQKNRGKGGALKTGMNYLSSSPNQGSTGVITVDADGQHSPSDIFKIYCKAKEEPNQFIIGTRFSRDESKVPLRSRFGNGLTKAIFSLFTGIKLEDTQSGLRYIPCSLYKMLSEIPANGYEFELEMLIKIVRGGIPIVQVPITTVYFGNNEGSHFNPIIDSLKIYYVFFRYSISSIITALIDYVIFIFSYYFSKNILVSIFAARCFAMLANFLLLKRFVFHKEDKDDMDYSYLSKYIFTVLIMSCFSYIGIKWVSPIFTGNILISKIVIELALFIFSFLIMRIFVFSSRPNIEHLGTDWDAYYSRPSAISFVPSITRNWTSYKLLRLMANYAPKEISNIVEFGGARSCFFSSIRKKYPSSIYTIIDNNQLGLDAFHLDNPSEKNVHLINADIIQPFKSIIKSDLTFSVGLIEHFPLDLTAIAIKRHFEATVDGGIVIITFPTPTILYRFTRGLLESLGLWGFPDERPLLFSEVLSEAVKYGVILHASINWGAILTQGIIVAQKSSCTHSQR